MDRRESLTILLSTILAVEGWLFTHLLDQVNTSPILEYRIEERNLNSQKREMIIQVQNLNFNKSFKNVELIIVSPQGSRILSALTTPVEPADDGFGELIQTENSASFTIDQIMPNSIIRTRIQYQGSRPNLRIKSDQQAILMIEPGIMTSVARNQSLFLILLMPLTAIGGYFILNFINRNAVLSRRRKSK